jgi:hypothetical protein
MTAPLVRSIPTPRVVAAHRIVQVGLLFNMVWKSSYFSAAASIYAKLPVDDSFFPPALRSVETLIAAYLITVGSIGLSLCLSSQSVRRGCAWFTILGLSVLCVHQGSYNDMTFVTAWWAGLWSLWFVHCNWTGDNWTGDNWTGDNWTGDNWTGDPHRLLSRGALLGRLIISMILLGGAVGKWTTEYWSGEVLFDIYFRDRDFWIFNLMRANFSGDDLRQIATAYSRLVIVVETVAGFGLWLLPARAAAIVGMVLLTSMALLANFLLFSVVSCLITLAAIGLLVPKSNGAQFKY